MRQNLAWAVGSTSLALPIAAGILDPAGFVLCPDVGAISTQHAASNNRARRRHRRCSP